MNEYQHNEIIKCKDSYEYFIRNYLNINLKDYQQNFLYRVHNYKNNILLAPRKSGKDFTVLPYLLWYALFQSNKNISILSNTFEDSKRLLKEVASLNKFMLPSMYEALHGNRPMLNDHHILFANGNSIDIRFGINAFRDASTDLLYVSDYNNFYNETYPVLLNGETSKIIIASSLNLPTDEFYKKWKYSVKGVGTFIPTKWDIEDTFTFVCDDFEKFKQETIANIGIDNWCTEFECKFREKSRDNTPGVNIENVTINGVPQKNIGIKYGKYFLPIYSSHKNTKTLFKLSEALEGLSSKEINIILEALNKLLLDKSIFNI